MTYIFWLRRDVGFLQVNLFLFLLEMFHKITLLVSTFLLELEHLIYCALVWSSRVVFCCI